MYKKLFIFAAASSICVSSGYAGTKESNTNYNNWKASFITEGLYVNQNSDEIDIPGIPSGAHNHGFQNGLQAGHNEAIITWDIFDKVSAQVSTAITEKAEEEGGGIEFELEEVFIVTQGLIPGFDLKGGRFFTDIGYLSSKHNHEWDFADQPLIYKAMFGAHPIGDGIQFGYLLPTDIFFKIGSELFVDEEFPSGDTSNDISAATFFVKTGGDIGSDHSWLAGIGHWRANNIKREGEIHSHVGASEETPQFSGDSSINTIGGVYKWAPNGNAKERHLKLQAEYFQRNESGVVNMLEPDSTIAESTGYRGDQSGWYMQAIYQFRPHWRIGFRHDKLKIKNTGSDEDVLEEASLLSTGHRPKRNSLMLDYSPREYSRLRLQFNRDQRGEKTDDQIILQYTHSFGLHGAHSF